MKCPRCDGAELDEREREGVTVDVCRACRGVWLDRGELEKILARAARYDEDDDDDDDDRYDRDRRRGYGGDAGPRRDTDEGGRREPRKRSWLESLGDLFD